MTQTEAARFIGVSQQRLSYWVRSGLLRVSGGGKHGKACDLTGGDVMRAWTVRELREQGASLQEIRSAVGELENLHHVDHWHGEWLIVGPGGAVLWFDKARDALLRLKDSQGYVIDVADIRRRVLRAEGKAAKRQTRRTRAKAGA